MRLAVRVTPRGGRDGVDGWIVDEAGRPVLKVRVAAAASEGAANAALVALLARQLKIPKSRLAIARGETSRNKQVDIAGIEAADLEAAFGASP